MTTEEGSARGLGKRKATAEAPSNATTSKQQKTDADEGDQSSYFPIMEEAQDEIEQVSLMLAFAEQSLADEANEDDDNNRAKSLLRAVVHECDRIGKIKEILEEGDQSQLALLDLDEESLASLKALTLRDELFRVMAEGLYRLSQVESEAESEGLLAAAIERAQVGLEMFPQSLSLRVCLLRLQLTESKIEEYLEAIAADAVNLERSLMQAMEMAVTLHELETPIMEMITSKWDALSGEIKLAAAKMALDSLDVLAEEDAYQSILSRMLFVHKVLSQSQSKEQSADEDSDVESKIAMDTVQARFHLWEGCVWDMEEDFTDADITLPHEGIPQSADAQTAYALAIAIHERLHQEHGLPIPDWIEDLQ